MALLQEKLMGIAEELKKWRMEQFRKNNSIEVSEDKDFACLTSDDLSESVADNQYELLSDSDQSDIIQIPLKKSKLHSDSNSVPNQKHFVKNNRVFVVPEGDEGGRTRKRKISAVRLLNHPNGDAQSTDEDMVCTLHSKSHADKKLKPLGLTRPVRRVVQVNKSAAGTSEDNINTNSFIEQEIHAGANNNIKTYDLEDEEEDALLKPAFRENEDNQSTNFAVELLDKNSQQPNKQSDMKADDSDSDLSLFEINVDLTGSPPPVPTNIQQNPDTPSNGVVKRQVAAVLPSVIRPTAMDTSSKPNKPTLISSSEDSDLEVKIPLISKKGKQPANKSKKVYVKRSKESKDKRLVTRTDNSKLLVTSPTDSNLYLEQMEIADETAEKEQSVSVPLSPLRIDDEPVSVSQ